MATPVVQQSTAAASYALAAGTDDCICVMMVQLHSASPLKKKDSNTTVVFIIWMGKIPSQRVGDIPGCVRKMDALVMSHMKSRAGAAGLQPQSKKQRVFFRLRFRLSLLDLPSHFSVP